MGAGGTIMACVRRQRRQRHFCALRCTMATRLVADGWVIRLDHWGLHTYDRRARGGGSYHASATNDRRARIACCSSCQSTVSILLWLYMCAPPAGVWPTAHRRELLRPPSLRATNHTDQSPISRPPASTHRNDSPRVHGRGPLHTRSSPNLSGRVSVMASNVQRRGRDRGAAASHHGRLIARRFACSNVDVHST
ncbi:hypothetical protein BC834DRAFT_501245 [Gloeopeniophorella convolvens]|nr:hypothetical protein BC834DRAFT_501245 [Gloeopeniophorella convolvens]